MITMMDSESHLLTNTSSNHFNEDHMSGVITINVGGTLFTTSVTTLTKYEDSMLGAMFSGRYSITKDSEGRPFIDSNPAYFYHILEFLRNGTLPPLSSFQVSTKRKRSSDGDLTFENPYDILEMYRQVLYYGIGPLVTKMACMPSVANQLVIEAERASMPNYDLIKERIISCGVKKASRYPPHGRAAVYIRVTHHKLPDKKCNDNNLSREMHIASLNSDRILECRALDADMVLEGLDDFKVFHTSVIADLGIRPGSSFVQLNAEDSLVLTRGMAYIDLMAHQLFKDGFRSSNIDSFRLQTSKFFCSECRHLVISITLLFREF